MIMRDLITFISRELWVRAAGGGGPALSSRHPYTDARNISREPLRMSIVWDTLKRLFGALFETLQKTMIYATNFAEKSSFSLKIRT